jgi:hypothetical protein
MRAAFLLLWALSAQAAEMKSPVEGAARGFAGWSPSIIRMEMLPIIDGLVSAKDPTAFLRAYEGQALLPDRRPERAAAALALGAVANNLHAVTRLAEVGLTKAELRQLTTAATALRTKAVGDYKLNRAIEAVGAQVDWVMKGAAKEEEPPRVLVSLRDLHEFARAAAIEDDLPAVWAEEDRKIPFVALAPYAGVSLAPRQSAPPAPLSSNKQLFIVTPALALGAATLGAGVALLVVALLQMGSTAAFVAAPALAALLGYKLARRGSIEDRERPAEFDMEDLEEAERAGFEGKDAPRLLSDKTGE